MLATLGATAPGCDREGTGQARAGALVPEEAVPVGGQKLAVGFAGARLEPRGAFEGDFAISKRPVTVARYRACVEAGACSEPAGAGEACASADEQPLLGATHKATGAGELPQTCVTPEQAAAYCASVGGTLPRLEQWLLAARGPSVRRYAWGDDEPDCAQHRRSLACESAPAEPAPARAASPSGLEDVLLTPAELVRSDPRSALAGCSGDRGACAVLSHSPGSIDVALRLDEALAAQAQAGLVVYGFRCVWEAAK